MKAFGNAPIQHVTERLRVRPFYVEVACVEVVQKGFAYQLHVAIEAPNRDDGTPVLVHHWFPLAPDAVRQRRADDEGFAELVAQCVSKAIDHEVREHVYLDGRRVLDPHAIPDWNPPHEEGASPTTFPNPPEV